MGSRAVRAAGAGFALAATLVAAFLLAAGSTRAAPRPARPNILIIVTDDQRVDTLDVMPDTMRWMGAEGTRFSNALVATPLCCPSRASIFTGRYAHNHRVTTNNSGERMDPRSTMQHYLSQAGYLTGIAGKYLNAWKLRKDPPSFDRWAIFRRGYRGRAFNVEGKVRRVRRYSTDYIAAVAQRFLSDFERRDRRPWLLFMTPHAPHEPATPAARHRASAVPPWNRSPAVDEADRTDKPPFVQAQDGQGGGAALVREKQLRSLMAVDDMVDRLMRRLGRLGERDRTLVVYLSDNGFFWSEHGLDDKRLPYLESIRVPFLMRWPGHVAGGVTDPRLVSTVDVMPTALQAAGFARRLRHPLDGRSLLEQWTRDRALSEYWLDRARTDIPAWASITTPSEQYIEYYGADERTVVFREYYDLAADPWQLENLLGDGDELNDPSPGHLSELHARLALDRACMGTEGPAACP